MLTDVETGLVLRRCWRSATVWGAVFGTVVYSSLTGYTSAYPTVASRQALTRSLSGNVGLEALFGPVRRIGTPAGFTAWRSMAILPIIGAIWGMLTATRLLRGDEESGQSELVLSGPTTKRRSVTAALAGLGAGWVVLFAMAASVIVPVGRTAEPPFDVTSSLFLAFALTASALIFLAVGALCAQLARTRRQASSLAALVFGVSYVVRLVADSGTGLSWLRWFSPLGWVEDLRPLTGSRPAMIVPIMLLIVALSAWTLWLAGARDFGAGVLPDRDRAAARTFLLDRPIGLALRTSRSTVLAWTSAVAALSAVLGLVAKSAGDATAGSKTVRDTLERLGGHGSGASAYLGMSFLVITAMTAMVAAGQISATRDEEGSGRLDELLVRPVGRAEWVTGRVVVAAVMVALLGVVAGVATWATAATQGAGLSVSRLVAAGLNTVPSGLFVLGLGVLVFGVAPRVAAVVTYAVVAWSFLVELVGSLVKASPALLDLSLFHHVALAPAADPRWGTAAVLIALGAAGAVTGTFAFSRRDLVSA